MAFSRHSLSPLLGLPTEDRSRRRLQDTLAKEAVQGMPMTTPLRVLLLRIYEHMVHSQPSSIYSSVCTCHQRAWLRIDIYSLFESPNAPRLKCLSRLTTVPPFSKPFQKPRFVSWPPPLSIWVALSKKQNLHTSTHNHDHLNKLLTATV